MRYLAFALTLLLPLSVQAETAKAPNVVTDIAPVHSLVAQVMKGVGTPTQIMRPGASPHGYAMRPSEARALAAADLVIWVGHGLTPWLEKPVDNLGDKAVSLELMTVKGISKFEYRKQIRIGEEEHGKHDDHDHAKHDDHGKAKHDDHHDHDHSGADPHAWMSPDNAMVWMTAIAEALAKADPANAATYRANAVEGNKAIAAAKAEAMAMLAPYGKARFVVLHDAYQYFEKSFGITSTGAVRPGDGQEASPARVAKLRAEVKERGITCAFSEPQFKETLVKNLFAGQGVKLARLDPLGSHIKPGADMYPALILDLATNISACLKP